MKFEVEINTSEKGFVAEFNSVQTVEPIVEPLEVTENGTYTAPDGVTGYTPVTVNVVPTGEITITENGVHDVSDYASAVVNVELVNYTDALLDGSSTEISSQAESVRQYALYSCTLLKKASFPVAHTFDGYSFAYCSALMDVYSPQVLSIKNNAFKSCRALAKFDAPMAIDIGDYAFSGCTMLEKVDFPQAQQVGKYAFSGCTMLEKADFSSLGNIPTRCFNSCYSMRILILRKTDAITTLSATNALADTNINSRIGYIYVPAALIDSYKAASGWSTYAAQFRALEDYTVDGTVTGELDESKI